MKVDIVFLHTGISDFSTFHYLRDAFFGASMNAFMENINLTAVRHVLQLKLNL